MTVAFFCKNRIRNMFEAPPCYGSNESIEAQILTLLECGLLAEDPSFNADSVVETYRKFSIDKKDATSHCLYPSQRLTDEKLIDHLKLFVHFMRFD